MELDDQDLSGDERRLAGELAALAVDASAERRDRIMAAVRSSHEPRRAVTGPWRLALAGLGAVGILMASAGGVVAASGDALPNSPNYSLRVLGEQARLALADPTAREQLRIAFATSRINQAQAILGHDRSNAKGLLRDSRGYLNQTRNELGSVPANQQGQIQNQLNQAEAAEHQAEAQLNQGGEQGQQ
jgi:hypothetical protein